MTYQTDFTIEIGEETDPAERVTISATWAEWGWVVAAEYAGQEAVTVGQIDDNNDGDSFIADTGGARSTHPFSNHDTPEQAAEYLTERARA